MKTITRVRAAFAFVVLLAGNLSSLATAQPAPVATGFIEGRVTGPNGPEAGVWVIAETHELPTKYVKIVVTDDAGRYVIPELPAVNYDVWVRGYGLVDSSKVKSTPGKTLDLTAVPAATPQAAARYYPAGHWFSLMNVPAKEEFPGTGPTGNGISPAIKNQAQFVRIVKSGGTLLVMRSARSERVSCCPRSKTCPDRRRGNCACFRVRPAET